LEAMPAPIMPSPMKPIFIVSSCACSLREGEGRSGF
jgi:hypothetical protein